MSITDQIAAAGVVGCGGAGFPTAVKLEAAKKRAIPPRKKKPLPLEFEKQSVIAVASI